MKSEEGFWLTNTVLPLAARRAIGRLKNQALLALAAIMISSFALPTPAAAQGLAVSGNFYRQHFQLLPGETVSTPDIYLIVFNHENDDIKVNLTTRTPAGVTILLDQPYFTLASEEHRKVEVGVSASAEATPGEYTLAVSAEVQPVEGKGVAIAGAAEQQAKITILSETAVAGTAENAPPATPGYTIDRFSVAPGYHDGTESIAYTNIEYVIKNTSQPLKSASIILGVTFNDEPLERVEIVSLPTLEPGNTSGSYKYIPAEGWQEGAYAFELELLSQDEVYARSSLEKLEDATPVSGAGTNWNINWSLVGAVAGGLIVIALAVLFRKRFNRLFPGIPTLIWPRKKRVYFENPEFSAISHEETGQPVTVKINYGINNKHKPVPDVRVELQVKKNDERLENIALTTLNPLEKGVLNLEYDYVPAEGWQKDAAYKFNLVLYIADKLHTIMPVSSSTGPAS